MGLVSHSYPSGCRCGTAWLRASERWLMPMLGVLVVLAKCTVAPGVDGTLVIPRLCSGHGYGLCGTCTSVVAGSGLGRFPEPVVVESRSLWTWLRDNIEAERQIGVQEEGSNTSKSPRREIPDILSWIQFFGIYVSVTASVFLERVPNMLASLATLVRKARRCSGGVCLPMTQHSGSKLLPIPSVTGQNSQHLPLPGVLHGSG